MTFGVGLSVQHSPDDSQAGRFQVHLEQVRAASAVGFDSLWASQHYLSAPFTYVQPIPVLARVAAETGERRKHSGRRGNSGRVAVAPIEEPTGNVKGA